jgi:hypothetical protein
MTDDLQKAYTAYQQALYRLPNPKVSCSARTKGKPLPDADSRGLGARIQNCGTVSGSCTIDMDRSNMPKKRFRAYFVWNQVSHLTCARWDIQRG